MAIRWVFPAGAALLLAAAMSAVGQTTRPVGPAAAEPAWLPRPAFADRDGPFGRFGGPGDPLADLQRRLAASEEEWKVIAPMVRKAQVARQAAEAAIDPEAVGEMGRPGGRFGGPGPGGRGPGGRDSFSAPGGGPGGPGGPPRDRFRREGFGQPSQPDPRDPPDRFQPGDRPGRGGPTSRPAGPTTRPDERRPDREGQPEARRGFDGRGEGDFGPPPGGFGPPDGGGFGPPPGGFGPSLGGFGPPPGGFGPPRGGPGGPGMRNNAVTQALGELQAALADAKTTDEQIRAKLAAVRAARARARAQLDAAQKELAELLTLDQQAVLVEMGVLD